MLGTSMVVVEVECIIVDAYGWTVKSSPMCLYMAGILCPVLYTYIVVILSR